MKENDIVDLLRSYIINYPIMRDWEVVDPICITLAFGNSMDSVKFLESLSGNPVIISEVEGVPSMKKAIQRKTPQSVFLRLSHCETEKEMDKLSLLYSVSFGEMIGERNVCCPSFVLYTGIVPDIIRRDTLVVNISLEGTNYDGPEDFFSLVPEPEQLGQVRQKLIDLGDLSEGEISLVSAACFLYPKLHERGEDSRYEEIVSLAASIENGDLETPPMDDVVGLVTDLFMELADKGDFEAALELPDIEESAVAVLDRSTFYDDRNLYISDDYFREICKPILEVVSYRDIKFALREAGILQGTGRRYVSKMYFWRAYGMRSSATMLKFNTEKIVKDNPLSFYFKL